MGDTFVQEILSALKQALEPHSGIPLELKDGLVCVASSREDGFDVVISHDEEEYAVWFGEGWHEHFKDRDEAVACFIRGLFSDCRIRVRSRGGTQYHWTVQTREGEKWYDRSTTALFLFPFWRRRKERYLQNNYLPERPTSKESKALL